MSEKIIHCTPDPSIEPDSRGLGVVLIEKMKQYENKIAQIDATTEETQTYQEMLLQSIRVAQHLQKIGIKSDDIIALCLPNILDSCLPLLAGIYLQIRACSLDPSLPMEDSAHLLNIVKPRLIFCIPESVNMIETALKTIGVTSQLVVFGHTKNHTPFSEFLVSTGTEDTFQAEPVNDLFKTAVILFSSGTTGLPKGICATHYGLLSVQMAILKNYKSDVSLYFTTFYWISAVSGLIICILGGTTRILCQHFETDLALKVIEKYKVTFAFMSPFILHSLARSSKCSMYNTSSLYSVVVGGGVISSEALRSARKCFPHTIITTAYGMTENHGYITYFVFPRDKKLIYQKENSVGFGMPDYYFKIVNPETNEILGPHKTGEIRIKGKCLTTGYHNKEDESKKMWDNDGYFCTGDIGYYDEDFCFYVVDRIKDVMKYQSWHVPPAELEHILMTHPAVHAAAVIGIPHPVDGEHPMGVVLLKPGVKANETEILDFINEKVSDRKKLRGGLKFVDSLPYTPTGKIQRKELRDTIAKS